MVFAFNFDAAEKGEKRKHEEENKIDWKRAKEIFITEKHFDKISNLESIEIFKLEEESENKEDSAVVSEEGSEESEVVEPFHFKVPDVPSRPNSPNVQKKEKEETEEKTGERIHFINSETVVINMKSSLYSGDLTPALEDSTDLVTGVYEGGLKIWECSEDLVRFLSKTFQDKLSGAKVLELGCGAGLPGVYAFSKGASVDFNDYNAEVLDEITIPNVLLNVPGGSQVESPAEKALLLKKRNLTKDIPENHNKSSETASKASTEEESNDTQPTVPTEADQNDESPLHRVDSFFFRQEKKSPSRKSTENRPPETRFFSGDWASLDSMLTDKGCMYNLVMTSETIYNPDNHNKLIKILRNHLAPGGVVLIAAKTYYFGVGGGTRDFQTKLEKFGFKVEIAKTFQDGLKREILSATLPVGVHQITGTIS